VLFVYNQLSFWAVTVGTNIFKDVPVIGPLVLSFLRGGLEVTSNTLTRFFTIHMGVLPTLMVLLLAVHIVLLRLYGISDLDPNDKRRITFFPDHILTEIIIGFYLIVILTSLATLFPPPFGELADPANTPLHIKPEWYFYPIYRWLRLVPGVWFPKRDLSVVFGSIVVVVAAAMVWEAFVV
jgi:quinol-cytochrome oxidoreductase complex cytochrome b subunit